MNLAFKNVHPDDFRYNIRFLEKKRNLIMDGDFVKLVYSDENTAMNSLFFVCALKIKQHPTTQNVVAVVSDPTEKSSIWFSPYEPSNFDSIQRMIEFEQVLIDEYKTHVKILKKVPVFSLRNQLLSGNTRMYKLNDMMISGESSTPPSTQIVVKISGIWESNENFGITYKFIEVYV